MKNEQNEKEKKVQKKKKGNEKKKTFIYLKYHPWTNNVHVFF